MTAQATKVVDPATLTPRIGSSYPEEFTAAVAEREKRALGDATGVTQFGVNLTRLPPGCASAQRHWHSREDEFVYIVSGELTLITDAGEQVLSAGMCAGFPAGVEDGHCIVNKTETSATILEVGTRDNRDEGNYPDDDLYIGSGRYEGKAQFTRKDGTPY